MLLIFGFVLIFFFGYLVTLLILEKAHLIERLGLSYLLGMGLLTFLMFLYSSAGIKIDLQSMATLLISLVLLLGFLNRKKLRRKVKFRVLVSSFQKSSRLEKALIFLIGLFILFSLVLTIYWPVNEWDSLALYDFRAKIIYNIGYFKQIAGEYEYFAHYPLLTSLSHVVVFLFGRDNPQFVYTLFYCSLIFVFYGTLRGFTTRKASLFTTFLMATIPSIFIHSTIAYTNLPYTVYFVSGMIYLYIFLRKGKVKHAFISGLLVGLSTWTRDVEPFWLTGFVIMFVYLLKNRTLRPLLYYSLPLLLIQQPWKIYLSSLYGEGRLVTNQVSQAAVDIFTKIELERYIQIFQFLYKYTISTWGLLLVLSLAALLIRFKTTSGYKSLSFLIIILANFAMLYLGTYLFSLNYPGWEEIPDSARRMSMFFPPLLYYYIGLTGIFDRILNKKVFKDLLPSLHL